MQLSGDLIFVIASWTPGSGGQWGLLLGLQDCKFLHIFKNCFLRVWLTIILNLDAETLTFQHYLVLASVNYP